MNEIDEDKQWRREMERERKKLKTTHIRRENDTLIAIYIYFLEVLKRRVDMKNNSPIYKRGVAVVDAVLAAAVVVVVFVVVIHILCAFSFHSFSIHSSFLSRTADRLCRCRGRGRSRDHWLLLLVAALHICIFSWVLSLYMYSVFWVFAVLFLSFNLSFSFQWCVITFEPQHIRWQYSENISCCLLCI